MAQRQATARIVEVFHGVGGGEVGEVAKTSGQALRIFQVFCLQRFQAHGAAGQQSP